MAKNVDIGPRIGIEGEAEYKKEMANIIQQAKTLDAEMKLVTSTFNAETTAEEKAAAQKKVLAQQIENQERKVAALRDAVDRATSAYGENDTKTLKLKESLNKAQAELNGMRQKMDDVGEATEDTGEEMEDAGEKSSRFADNLKANLASEAIIGGIKAIGSAIKAVGEAAVDGVKKIASAINETADAGDEIDKFSQKLGMSAEAYQKWDYILGLAGVEVTSMTTGMKTLTNQIDNAKNGTSGAAEKFAALGISMEQLRELSREDIFAAVVTGFQGMADSTERAALANDLFGKSGQELTPLFNATAEATAEEMRAAEELGFVMSNEAVAASAAYKDSLNTLQRTFDGLRNNLAGEFLPSITTVMDGVTMILSGKTDEGIETIRKGIEDFSEQAREMGPIAEDMLNLFVETVIDLLPDVLDAAGDLVITLCDGILKEIPELLPVAVEVIDKLCAYILDPNNLNMIIDLAIEIILTLADALVDAIPVLVERLPVIVEAIIRGIGKVVDEIPTIGKNLVTGLWNGISEMKDWILSKIRGFGSSILSGMKDFFGIHSPSRVMEDEVGRYLGEGITKGMERGVKATIGSAKRSIYGAMDFGNDFRFDPFPSAPSFRPRPAADGSRSYTYGDVNVTINAPDGIDERRLAELVISRIGDGITRAEGVFA